MQHDVESRVSSFSMMLNQEFNAVTETPKGDSRELLSMVILRLLPNFFMQH